MAALVLKLEEGEAVGVETVLSSGKYRPVVEAVLSRGGFVGLIYISLDSPETACARVRRRVAHGGHNVLKEKIVTRWHRSIQELAWFLPRASRFWVYDNSDSDPQLAPKLLAVGSHGFVDFLAPNLLQPLSAVLLPLMR
jgi:predicted ABC-type ATPase